MAPIDRFLEAKQTSPASTPSSSPSSSASFSSPTTTTYPSSATSCLTNSCEAGCSVYASLRQVLSNPNPAAIGVVEGVCGPLPLKSSPMELFFQKNTDFNEKMRLPLASPTFPRDSPREPFVFCIPPDDEHTRARADVCMTTANKRTRWTSLCSFAEFGQSCQARRLEITRGAILPGDALEDRVILILGQGRHSGVALSIAVKSALEVFGALEVIGAGGSREDVVIDSGIVPNGLDVDALDLGEEEQNVFQIDSDSLIFLRTAASSSEKRSSKEERELSLPLLLSRHIRICNMSIVNKKAFDEESSTVADCIFMNILGTLEVDGVRISQSEYGNALTCIPEVDILSTPPSLSPKDAVYHIRTDAASIDLAKRDTPLFILRNVHVDGAGLKGVDVGDRVVLLLLNSLLQRCGTDRDIYSRGPQNDPAVRVAHSAHFLVWNSIVQECPGHIIIIKRRPDMNEIQDAMNNLSAFAPFLGSFAHGLMAGTNSTVRRNLILARTMPCGHRVIKGNNRFNFKNDGCVEGVCEERLVTTLGDVEEQYDTNRGACPSMKEMEELLTQRSIAAGLDAIHRFSYDGLLEKGPRSGSQFFDQELCKTLEEWGIRKPYVGCLTKDQWADYISRRREVASQSGVEKSKEMCKSRGEKRRLKAKLLINKRVRRVLKGCVLRMEGSGANQMGVSSEKYLSEKECAHIVNSIYVTCAKVTWSDDQEPKHAQINVRWYSLAPTGAYVDFSFEGYRKVGYSFSQQFEGVYIRAVGVDIVDTSSKMEGKRIRIDEEEGSKNVEMEKSQSSSAKLEPPSFSTSSFSTSSSSSSSTTVFSSSSSSSTAASSSLSSSSSIVKESRVELELSPILGGSRDLPEDGQRERNLGDGALFSALQLMLLGRDRPCMSMGKFVSLLMSAAGAGAYYGFGEMEYAANIAYNEYEKLWTAVEVSGERQDETSDTEQLPFISSGMYSTNEYLDHISDPGEYFACGNDDGNYDYAGGDDDGDDDDGGDDDGDDDDGDDNGDDH